jgi:hypothetical protein
MNKITIITIMLLFTSLINASENGNLLKRLSESKFTLKEVIANAEKISGPATSAKFELDGTELVYSVYTAPQGLEVSAEETTLSEVSGSATVSPINSKIEVFSDKEHIARASTHLTLRQLSKFSLAELIDVAQTIKSGVVYSIKNPIVKNKTAVAEVLILMKDGRTELVNIDMFTAKVICN